MSGAERKADENQQKRTLAGWISGAEGKAVVIADGTRQPLIAICGRLPVGKGFYDGDAASAGAAICPAFGCGTIRWPLAIMLSADQVPVKSKQSHCCTG